MRSVGVKANAWRRVNAATDLGPQGPPIRANARKLATGVLPHPENPSD